ncbi:MAG: lipase family protein [Woeseiaceae bacterium]
MGRSLLAVIFPQKFTPAIISESRDFESLWKTKKHWVFSNLSHIAYFSSEQIQTFMQQLGAEKTCFYNHKGAQAYLSIWEDKAVLCFRGTQSVENPTERQDHLNFVRKFFLRFLIKLPINPFSLLSINNDIWADLKLIQTSFNNQSSTKVHSGFLEEINKIWDNSEIENNILNDIQQHVGEKPIWVTGHSLGGAMATLAGMKYSFQAVTTFGEPRVGKNIGKSFISTTHTRFVNGDDPVTKVPPRLFSYYKHHGNKIHIHKEPSDFIYDHSIIYYSENLY